MKPALLSLCLLCLTQEQSNPPIPSGGELREEIQDNGERSKDQRTPEESSPLPVTDSELGSPPPRTIGSETLGMKERNAHQDERDNKEDKPSGSEQSVFRMLPIFEKSFWRRVSDIVLRFEPYLMLIFTATLVGLAYLQRRLNKKFFILAHRPRLEVRDIKYPKIPKLPAVSGLPKDLREFNLAANKREAEGTRGYLEVVNAGGSVAKPFQEYVAIQMVKGVEGDWDRPWRDVRCKVGIGKQHRIVYMNPEWSDKEIEQLSEHTGRIYFRGGVRYRDKLGFKRTTEFRHEHMKGTGFVRMPNAPFNTQD